MSGIQKVGVIGAGTMGSGIAQKLAQEGFEVVMIDTEDRFVERGLGNIRGVLNEGVKRRLFTSSKVREIMGRIHHSTETDAVGGCDLIIEAIYEDFDAKSHLLSQLSEIFGKDTVVATNTSSFSISQLAESIAFPERFMGLHFFYHAAKNRLVEVIRGKKTTERTYQRAMRFVKQMGKDPIVCSDSYGFAVNRFFVPWLNEAVRLLEEGVALPQEIDNVCRSLFGVTMGPFALMNVTGLPIAYQAQKTLENGFGSFYRPAETLKKQVELNLTWTLVEQPLQVGNSISRIIGDRMLGVVFLVCGQILDEGVTSPGELNRGARIGLRWEKGPIELMRELGEERVKELAATVAEKWSVKPPASLTREAWTIEFVTSEKSDKFALLTLTRPEDLNALNRELLHQLRDRFKMASDDDRVETIFITGRGKAFMAGADIKFFVRCLTGNGNLEAIRSFTELGHQVFSTIDESGKRVVAVINGLALGGGLELALTADIIVATDNGVFAFPETGIGIYPGLGGTVRTPRRIGRGLTKYLVYTGTYVKAGDAKAIGLIDEVMSLDDAEDMMAGARPVPPKVKAELSPRWAAIAEYFSVNGIKSILDGQTVVPEGLSNHEAKEMERVIQTKAPRALNIAQKLIDEGESFEAELENLEKVFATEDALVGLKSVGGKPPRFKGR